jgi:hypothetical protein
LSFLAVPFLFFVGRPFPPLLVIFILLALLLLLPPPPNFLFLPFWLLVELFFLASSG